MEKKFKCEKCGKMFVFKSTLDIHVTKCDGVLRMRYSGKKSKCGKCSKTFAFQSNLDKHVKECDEVLRKRKEGNYNMIIGKEGKQFQCKKCEDLFSSKISFHNHFGRKHREKKFKCEKCSKLFVYKTAFESYCKICKGRIGSCKMKIEKKEITDSSAKFKLD